MAILVNTIDDADDTHAIQQCVQCGHDYAEKDNVSGSCDYHPAISYTYHSWSCELSCCGMSLSSYTPFPSSGCTKGSHAKAHHDRFPYINRLGHYRTILQGSDTWLRVQQHDVTVAKSDGADIGATLAGHVGILRDNESVAVWATQDGVIIDLNVLPLPPSDPNNDTTVVLIATNVSTLINDTWNKDIAADGLGWSVQVTRASLPANGSCFRISVHTPTAPTPNVKELHVHGDSADASRSIITVFDNDTDLHDLYPSTDSSLSPSPPPSIQSFRRIPPQLFCTSH
ncbi:hypothetical protein DYB36_006663 [Aphanomyces astaci]|uniref:Uncharacterized protein n=1 Tax=Aphanomyces astaci TaxID=112090 RepID=A0A397B4Q8_APHAT|nr:hypothetical protein DYB36_006663 [Aphanomyces astaci]